MCVIFHLLFDSSTDTILKAIEDDAEAPIAVIDKRAATFLKLADFDRALSDAGAIIRRDQTNVIVSDPIFMQRPPLKHSGLSQTWSNIAVPT